MRTRAGNLALLVAVAVAAGAAAETAEQAPWPTKTWPRSTPAAQGLEPEPLDRLVATLRENERIRNIHSLLIVKNGYLVVEQYFDGHEADELHTLQSVSKSFTSALVGIAIDKGKIAGVHERVLDFFPELADRIENVDERKRAITLEDLLTMRSGTDYHERGSDSPHHRLNRMRRGWTEFILSRPMIAEPGTTFRYDSGAVILTSAIIKARYGVHADAFADRYLFGPLGIERRDWFKNAEGHPHTGGGLGMRSRDVAKFGLLYLRGGRWEDRQIVSGPWVRTSLKRHVTFERDRGGTDGYGYWWWTMPDGVVAACGFMGQYIFLAPAEDMVVVVTAAGRGWQEERAPRDFLYSHILPAARRVPERQPR